VTGPALAGASSAIHSKPSRGGATGLKERNCNLGQLRQALIVEVLVICLLPSHLYSHRKWEPNQSLDAPSRKARDDLLLPSNLVEKARNVRCASG
jgi:hypothetical protein